MRPVSNAPIRIPLPGVLDFPVSWVGWVSGVELCAAVFKYIGALLLFCRAGFQIGVGTRFLTSEDPRNVQGDSGVHSHNAAQIRRRRHLPTIRHDEPRHLTFPTAPICRPNDQCLCPANVRVVIKRIQVFPLRELRLPAQRSKIRGGAAHVTRRLQIKRLTLASICGRTTRGFRVRRQVFLRLLPSDAMVRYVVFPFARTRIRMDRGRNLRLQLLGRTLSMKMTTFIRPMSALLPYRICNFRKYCRILCFRAVNASVLCYTHPRLAQCRQGILNAVPVPLRAMNRGVIPCRANTRARQRILLVL